MNLPKRKNIRLADYDYNTPGYYFITICTKEKQKLLSHITDDLPGGPQSMLTEYGHITNQQLLDMHNFYQNISVDKYCIMPNHIHLILHISGDHNGPSGRPVPTNSVVFKFVGTFKRFCSKRIGHNIWQARSNDHVIRGEQDCLKIWNYIDGNPSKWKEDCFYTE